jgi:hypothetical protein
MNRPSWASGCGDSGSVCMRGVISSMPPPYRITLSRPDLHHICTYGRILVRDEFGQVYMIKCTQMQRRSGDLADRQSRTSLPGVEAADTQAPLGWDRNGTGPCGRGRSTCSWSLDQADRALRSASLLRCCCCCKHRRPLVSAPTGSPVSACFCAGCWGPHRHRRTFASLGRRTLATQVSASSAAAKGYYCDRCTGCPTLQHG